MSRATRRRDSTMLAAALAAAVVLVAGLGLVEFVGEALDDRHASLSAQWSQSPREAHAELGGEYPPRLATDSPATRQRRNKPTAALESVSRSEIAAGAAQSSRPTFGPWPADEVLEPPRAALQGANAPLASAKAPSKERKMRAASGSGDANVERRLGGLTQPEAFGEASATDPLMADLEAPDAAKRGRSQAAMPGRAAAEEALESDRQAIAVGGRTTQDGPREIARRFLAERERLTGLHFQPGSGYWANTYVPGDPAIRLLEARLQRWNRSALAAGIGDARLEATVRQNRQPFDVPQNAALAVYLHADKPAVTGRARLRVQVGLQASRKRSGLRPNMNVGVVLDLRRPLDDTTGAKLRALMMALAEARQPGDRFSVTVAGHPGGLLVEPAQFRHGPVRVAMQSLFAHRPQTRRPAMDLLAAVATATENVRQGDDASAPLGASLVMLVSTASFGEQRESLERMAHENAISGIGLSVIAVGDSADLASIDRLVLLGQGHRRVLVTAESAAQLVDRELHAASRAVARAVRLRIRLAPGVELVDVLGSKNLSESAAERVRETERSIDERLARNIGIRADRGEDEEGIQIVIPSFFAGDGHAVVLDVVVPGSGPVADVSVRYKDLVYRRNGVARAQLTVEDGHRDPGPLQRNVLKNQLAHELARLMELAGRRMSGGDAQGAVETLESTRDLLIGMRLQIPGWDSDDELREDVALLEKYLQALGSGYAATAEHRQHLADSLRYVAFRRLIPPYK